MNPLETVVKCQHDGTRMQWLYSLPDRKDVHATYEHTYQCVVCNRKLIVRSETIRFRDHQEQLVTK